MENSNKEKNRSVNSDFLYNMPYGGETNQPKAYHLKQRLAVANPGFGLALVLFSIVLYCFVLFCFCFV